MEGIFYVYVLFRPDTAQPCYVGKGSRNRWTDHDRKASNPHLAAIIRKFGELPKVKIREGLSDVDAFALERIFITAIGRRKDGGPLVNMTDGGDGLLNPAPEVREKIQAKAKQRAQTPEGRAHLINMGAKNKGVKKSAETRAKMSASAKAKTPEHQAKINAAIRGKPKPYMVARNKALTGIKRGPYDKSHREAIAEGNRRYWARWRSDPAVRAARQEHVR